MPPQRFRLNKTEYEELCNCWENEAKETVRIRCQAVYLYGTGHSVEEILSTTGCSRTSLMEWCQKYRQWGASGLRDKRQGGNSAKLDETQIDTLKRRLRTRKPIELFGAKSAGSGGQFWMVEDLERAVQMWFEVRYKSRTSYYNLFTRCGFRYNRSLKAFKPHDESSD